MAFVQLEIIYRSKSPERASFNLPPMWNSHSVRELDDGGYIDKLYK
jgi:hypothetical protein